MRGQRHQRAAEAPIGFIGLGRMGAPMAARLAKAGHPLVVDDTRPGAASAFAEAYGSVAASTQEVGRRCSVVITMLPTGADVSDVVLGTVGDGLLGELSRGSVVVDMSSSAPEQTRGLGEVCKAAGVILVDAPVSGGVARAADGTLAVMVGTDDPGVLPCVLPLLKVIGSKVLHLGKLGNGHSAKALNNALSAVGLASSLEVLVVGSKLGLPPARLLEVLNASTGRNNATERKIAEFVLSRRFNYGATIATMVKDLTIAQDLGKSVGATTPFLTECLALVEEASLTVGLDADQTALARYLEGQGGTVLDDA